MARKNNTLFNRLTSLFRSGPIVKRKIQGFRSGDVTSSALDVFRKSVSGVYGNALNAYGSYDRLSRYADFSEMEYCVIGSTKIAVPGGYKTIEELANEYGSDKEFVVYAWDINLGMRPVYAKQARKTRTDHAWKVSFENGQEIIATKNHRLMMQNGVYARVEDLFVGDYLKKFNVDFQRAEKKETLKPRKYQNRCSNPLPDDEFIRLACSKKTDFDNSFLDQLEDFGFRGMDNTQMALRWFRHYYDYENRKDQPYHGTSKINWEDGLKIKSIEYHGVIDLYDLTVDGYKNFATDSVISHNTPEISSAISIHAEESVAPDDQGRSVHVYSDNSQIQQLLEELFYDTLNVEFNLRAWVRNLCKYGDFFLFNDVSPEYGVINAFPIPVNEIEREEGWDPEDPLAVRFRWVTQGNQQLENWQITHLRLIGNDAFLPYGSSILESARRIWRQLILIEDSMLVYRIVRSPERRVFYIDVCGVPNNEVPNVIEHAKTTLKSQEVIDKDSGRVDLRYNPFCLKMSSLVPLLDGRTIQLKEIIDEFERGKSLWTHSLDRDSEKLVAGKIVWAGITKQNAQLVRVYLDNGKWVDCTPDHRFMTKVGSYVEASKLQVGESLMPLYKGKRKIGKRADYETTFQPFSGMPIPTHRFVVQTFYDDIEFKNKVIHHSLWVKGKGFDHKNNNPENLQLMDIKEHRNLHKETIIKYNKSKIGRENSRQNMKKMWNDGKISVGTVKQLWKDPEIRQKRVDKLSLNFDERFIDFCMKIMSRLNTKMSTKESTFRKTINEDSDFQQYLRDLNPNFKNGFNDRVLRGQLQKILKSLGFSKAFTDLKRSWILKTYDVTEIIKFCKSMNCEVLRKDVLDKFKFGRMDYETLVELSGFNYVDFSKTYTQKSKKYYNKQPLNHKVVKVEWIEQKEDTGCITVEKYHNFAVIGSADCFESEELRNASGVFVHNSVDIDYFLPVRGGETGTKIDTLPGGQNTTAIDDVEYIQNKLFSALKVPKAYLNFTEQLTSKANLAQEDIRFSRTINAIQKVVISELNKLATIHLFANGFEDDDLLDFTIQLSNPSTVAQQQKLELIRTKFEIASSKPEFMLSTNWLYKNVFHMTDAQIRDDEEHMIRDMIQKAKLDALGEPGEGEGGFGGAGGGGGFGAEAGGLEGLGGEEEGGDLGGDLGGLGGGEEGFGEEMPGEEGGEEELGGDEEEEDLFAGEEEEEPENILLDSEEDDAFELDEDEDKKQTPIKPQHLSQTQRFKHNQQRLVHGSGRSKTVMPDLASMNMAKAFADVNDDRFLKSPFKEGEETEQDVLGSMVVQQHRMSKKLEDTLKSMKKAIGIPKAHRVLTEGTDNEDLFDIVFDEEEVTPEDLVIEQKLDEIIKNEKDND